ncbi:MAG TPA: DEAD/DEAH box helicase [Candidatus Latescibacteria bacterium]|nr:DEAD/DEAH box helicase [Candidatus Latescibacterota bacterium]
MDRVDHRIKGKLLRTWFPFFSRFGKLREVQRQCIPLVLNRANLVVCSPTATGKTEAILAPLIERLLTEDWSGLGILWVSPTRALVNDLYARFTHPLGQLKVSFARKTGDRPEFNPDHPPSVLITTPESFDSLLSRHPSTFEGLKAVVLDDVHLLDGTYRGDQIRILLERLKLINPSFTKYYALSATIGDPYGLGTRYLPDFEVVNIQKPRQIDFYLLSADDNPLSQLLLEFRKRGLRKILVFTNSRHEAEQMAVVFEKPPFMHRTFVHHGSMSKREREAIEHFMNSSPVGVCIATTTLELGIDISDIDAVVLFGPPHDVRSFLQRIGRGNRRREDYALAYGVFSDAWEKLLFEVLFKDARDGRLDEETYFPHLSVAVQQIFSYLYQRRRVGATVPSLGRVLKPIMPERYILPLIDHLSERGYVKAVGEGVFAPSDKLLNRAERGWIHSNIDRKPVEYTVMNAENWQQIGSIQLASPQFQLGGRFWRVIKVEKDRAWVKPIKSGFKGSGRIFRGKNCYWNYRLGLRLKQRLFPELGELEYPYREHGGEITLFHFCGPVYGFIWQEALREKGIRAEDVEGKLFVAQDLNEPAEMIPEKELLIRAIKENAKCFKRFLSLGSYLGLLPSDLQDEAVVEAFGLEEFIIHLEKMVFEEITGTAYAVAMERLGK